MKTLKGYVSLVSLLLSSLVGFGGLGSFLFLANNDAIFPQRPVQALSDDTGGFINFHFSPTATPAELETTLTPTQTPTLEITPIVSPSLTPTPTVIAKDQNDTDEYQESDDDGENEDGQDDEDGERKTKMWGLKTDKSVKKIPHNNQYKERNDSTESYRQAFAKAFSFFFHGGE